MNQIVCMIVVVIVPLFVRLGCANFKVISFLLTLIITFCCVTFILHVVIVIIVDMVYSVAVGTDLLLRHICQSVFLSLLKFTFH